MPIPFACPHCGAKSNVPDQYAGQTGPCASCGQSVTIPFAGKGPPPSVSPGVASAAAAGGVGIVVVVIGALAVVCLLCVLIGAALLLPAVQAAREAARRTQCLNNIKQIGLAFHNYQNRYKTFPPAYIPDENGKPKHSWRVLILPYLGQKPLYDQYNFDEPWDSPGNLKVAQQMPHIYACPTSSQQGSQQTVYQVIVGPNTVFPGDKGSVIAQIKDGIANTLLVVESAKSQVRWTEPADLDFNKMQFVGGGGPGEIDSDHAGGANVLFCDGSVRFLPEDVSRSDVRAMATRNGGEAIRPAGTRQNKRPARSY